MANKFEQFSSTNNEYEQENTCPNTVKENVKEEINFAINADDSTTVMLFQKLVSE